MSGIVFVKEVKKFMDGTVLWMELENAETGEIKRISGKELDAFKQKRAGEAEEQANHEEVYE